MQEIPVLQSPSNLWCLQLVRVININKNILFEEKCHMCKQCWRSLPLGPVHSLQISTCIIAVLTFSMGSSESKRLRHSLKGTTGSEHHVSSLMESPQISAAPTELPLATLSQSANGAWKTRDLTLSHLHIPVTFCLIYVQAQYPDKVEGRLQPFHLHSLLC